MFIYNLQINTTNYLVLFNVFRHSYGSFNKKIPILLYKSGNLNDLYKKDSFNTNCLLIPFTAHHRFPDFFFIFFIKIPTGREK